MKLAWVFVAACSAPAPPVTTGSAASTGPKKVVSLVDAQANAGKRVEVYGKAGNAKLGAVIQTEGRVVVYCAGVPEWPRDLDGKDVDAFGTLTRDSSHEATTGPGGEISQGTSGPIWTLANCEYK